MGSTVWNYISQPIAASIGGVGPRAKHVILPAGECCERSAEACNSLAGHEITGKDIITSRQCNVDGRVASFGERSAPQAAKDQGWPYTPFRYGDL